MTLRTYLKLKTHFVCLFYQLNKRHDMKHGYSDKIASLVHTRANIRYIGLWCCSIFNLIGLCVSHRYIGEGTLAHASCNPSLTFIMRIVSACTYISYL